MKRVFNLLVVDESGRADALNILFVNICVVQL